MQHLVRRVKDTAERRRLKQRSSFHSIVALQTMPASVVKAYRSYQSSISFRTRATLAIANHRFNFMDQGIAALISAGVTAIIGPILVLIFQRRINEAGLPPASEERLNLLRGEWHGYFRQVISGKEENFIAEGTLINRRKIIQGELNYMGGDGKRVFLILYNGIFDGNILKVEYKNKNIHVFQYGSAVMRMNAKGNMLEGKFVGFSPSLERIISGEVRFSDGPGRLQETS